MAYIRIYNQASTFGYNLDLPHKSFQTNIAMWKIDMEIRLLFPHRILQWKNDLGTRVTKRKPSNIAGPLPNLLAPGPASTSRTGATPLPGRVTIANPTGFKKILSDHTCPHHHKFHTSFSGRSYQVSKHLNALAPV